MSANRQEGAPPSNRIPKRLIVVCDGTGQDSLTPVAKAKPTNITRLSRAIARFATVNDKAIEQVVYYQPGVGTETGEVTRGGAYGLGVSANVRAAYAFFAHNYEFGDQIYLFGFSRGAYTARAIAGLVTGAGLLTKRGMDRFPEVYADCYTNIPKEKPGENKQVVSEWLREDLKANGEIDESARDAVQLIGVFDTVGFHAEGFIDKLLGSTEEPEFNNTRLSPSVKYGYHALALDEERRPFEPTLWQVPNAKDLAPQAKDRNVEMEQVWFSGVHSDIGGGMDKAYLSDITLAWMISRCSGEDKLAFTDIQMNDQWYLFQPTTIGKLDDPVPPSAPWDTRLGVNDSSSHTWKGDLVSGIENLGHCPRPAPRTQEHTNETIHRSIRDRNMLGNGPGTKWVCKLLTGEVVGGEYVIQGNGKTLKVQVDAEKDTVEDMFHGRIRALPLDNYVDPSKKGAKM